MTVYPLHRSIRMVERGAPGPVVLQSAVAKRMHPVVVALVSTARRSRDHTVSVRCADVRCLKRRCAPSGSFSFCNAHHHILLVRAAEERVSAGRDIVPGRRLLREPAPAAARAWCSARRGAPAAGCFHHHRRLMHIMVAAPCASGVSGASGVCCCSCRWANRHERTRRVDHRLTSVSPATTPGLDTTIACADTRFRYGSSQRSQRTSLLPCRVTVRPVVACPADVSLLSSDLHALIMP